MTVTQLLFAAAAFLAAWGLLTAWVARRFGRDPYAWWAIGTVLGPLSLPMLASMVRATRSARLERLPVGPPRLGAPRVLVPSPTPSGLHAAVPAILNWLGWLHPTVTLAVVADMECAPGATAGAGRRLQDALDRATPWFVKAEAALQGLPVEREVLFGEPTRATIAESGRGAHACVVLATPGWPGGRRALARLALASACPVLVSPRRATPRRDARDAPVSPRSGDGRPVSSATTTGSPR